MKSSLFFHSFLPFLPFNKQINKTCMEVYSSSDIYQFIARIYVVWKKMSDFPALLLKYSNPVYRTRIVMYVNVLIHFYM